MKWKIRRSMAIPVDLDHQLRLGNIEVSDKPINRVLTSDLEPELTASNRLPDLRLRRRQRVTEVARALEDGGRDSVQLRGLRHLWVSPSRSEGLPQPFSPHPLTLLPSG